MKKIPTQNIDEAIIATKARNFTFDKIMSSAILRIRDWEYCFLGWAYLKCVDDLIDNDENYRSALASLNCQKEFMNKIYSVKLNHQDLPLPERLGFHFFCYDKENNSQLRPFIQSMIEAMEFDIHRRNKILSKLELDNYAIKMGGATIRYLGYFISNDLDISQSFIDHSSLAYVYADSLIDIEEDLKVGIINIPIEDIERYGIRLNTSDVQLKQWLEIRSKEVLEYFKTAFKESNHLNNFSMKMLAYLYLFRKRNNLKRHLKNIRKRD